MSFPKTLAVELAKVGLSPAGHLAYSLPASRATVQWHISFRTLGFAKDQIDAALRYHHRRATPFGWHCLANYAGERWAKSRPKALTSLSSGFSVGPVAGWRSNFTFDNRGLSSDESATKVASDIRTRVIPFLAGVQTDEQLLTLLKSDEEPYPWFRCQGLARLAEVAVLEVELNETSSSVIGLAEKFAPMLRDQLDGIEVMQYAKNVLASAHSDA